MSYRGPKAKLSRRLGVALTNKAALVMQRKPHAPGQHGQRRRPSHSEYARQLMEKQRIRFQYNVSEKQMRIYFKKARAMKGNTPDSMVKLLESRLDNLVYRAGFAPSIYAARQLVTHRHVQVNGSRVDRPSYQVKPEDVISIRDKSKNMIAIKSSLESAVPPPYMQHDKEKLTASMTRLPERGEVPIICDTQLVVEYYSR